MGAAIAAILTYIFREHEEFSSTTCVAFGPGMFLRRGLCTPMQVICAEEFPAFKA